MRSKGRHIVVKSSQFTFPQSAKLGSVRHQSSLDEAVKPQSQQGDSDLIHQRPRDTKLLTPAQVSCTWGGRDRANTTLLPHFSGERKTLTALSPSALSPFIWVTSGLWAVQFYSPAKNIYLSRGNNSNVKPLEKCKAVT